MNRFLLATETRTYRSTGRTETIEFVKEYSEGDMEEIFTPHELLWLSEGKIVERLDNAGGRMTFIDMVVAAKTVAGKAR